MEKKNNLFKSIFFVFFAFCFLSAGIAAINKNQIETIAAAEDVSQGKVNNQNIPSYFSAQEFISDGSASQINSNSLISSDTFMFFTEGTSSNYLKLSLLINGPENSPHDIYRYVYYPDLSNLSVFYFYSINSVSLYVNGSYKEINMGDYIKSSGLSFPNKSSALLEQFEMIFSENGYETNEVKITDDSGNIIEGVYNLSLSLTLYTCTDGKTTTAEEQFSDRNVTINYSFYVADRENYFLNNRPNVTRRAFDHEVSVSNLTNPNYAYYLYSNFSSKSAANLNSNKIPYVEYDYTRYELAITKNLSSTTYTANLLYDKDANSASRIAVKGDKIVKTKIDTANKLCRVYFTDVGDYSITLSAIQVINYNTEGDNFETRKYAMDGMTSVTKKLMVYMYGYQANYTDLDQPADANNVRPLGELKDYNLDSGLFQNSADITSSFMHSNTNYSQANGSTTFLTANILNYINTNSIAPVKTNQTPIKLSVNANLSTTVSSYIFSTTKVSEAYLTYTTNGANLNGNALYRATFSGTTAGTAGTYIYILAYTYKNYYLTETTLSANTTFYQVFYFEIVKDLPAIEIATTAANKTVSSDTFVNENVNIIDSTQSDIYNKDVTIQVYAYNYTTKSYLEGFGGTSGISFNSLLPVASTENFITLEKSAFYTVRLYYSNEVTASNLLLSSTKGFFREQTFTIDKNPIANIMGRNVQEITSSTDFKVVSSMANFSTNQNMVLSWDEKASGAKTWAYYRYFPIIDAQYYSNREATLSTTLDRLLNYAQNISYLPVNSLLNLSTTNNNWLTYKGNTVSFSDKVSAEYVFSDAGLYLVDVYDEAGNHTVDVFMIDTTTPYFAIFDGEKYSLTPSSVYVTTPSTLYWARYKGIFIVNFNTISYNSSINPGNVTVGNLSSFDFYRTHDNLTSTDIFKVMYNKLFSNNYMQVINCAVSPSPATDGTSNLISGYSGMYMTIPLNELSYFIDAEHLSYTAQSGVYSYRMPVDREMTYRVLIRDMSNTKLDLNYAPTATIQYTNYFSAKQTIIVSFDSSEFFIQFTNQSGETEPITSNNVVEGTVDDSGTSRKTKTTYLSPTSMNKAFTLSFLPTITGEDLLIQVATVTIKFYPYIRRTTTVGSITYHSYELSSEATEIQVYNFEENGSMTGIKEDEIRLNSENITTSGKYEISRTYYTEGGYSYNENDYYIRTYHFYVDRNEVISNAELVSNKDGSGNITSSHLESLVGGDVFVAMYDNKTNASLVVTFPNSEKGNTNGSSLYNNGNVRSVLTTNMLPVYVYVPQYKYTTYAQKVNSMSGYNFEVNYDSYHLLISNTTLYTDADLKNSAGLTLTKGIQLNVLETTTKSTKISYNSGTYFISNSSCKKVDYDNYYSDNILITDYALYAEIYRNGTDASHLVAMTSTNSSNPTFESVISDGTGFLNFYTRSGTKLEYLSEAGSYYVKIYQGRFGVEIGENNYEQALTFSFDINKSNPDFVAQSITGAALNSVAASPAPTDYTRPSVTYYTNQSNISLIWDAGSTYMADIDIAAITFKTSKNATFTTSDDIFTERPALSNSSYISQLNLKKLNIYENNAYVDITMQYENHNDKFYSKVTKRIYVDLSAPSTNVQALVTNSTSGNMIAPLTNSALRTYFTANLEQTTDLNNTSYNISNKTGTFAYYSYNVTKNFLQTLKTSLTTDVHVTYIREFVDAQGENTKYTAAEQETAPADFLASNFKTVDDKTEFKTNTYYEIIETDRAGNMSIYTVYITVYSSDSDPSSENNHLLTYQDADGKKGYYTVDDYLLAQSYTNATHNVYAKTGFTLQNINFFGDGWSQIKLDTLNVNGFTTTKYLMLTPWDKEYAYAFVGSNYTKIAIRDLIDGTTSSRYKNCLSIYNRENKSTTNFYINIRNTSLSATLTDNQNREYIRFAKPTDSAIQNSIYASTFITSLKVKANSEVIYDKQNKLGFASLWQSNSNITISVDNVLSTITFEINPLLGFSANTRIVYEYTDNYGNVYKELHLYKETIITKEITSQQDLYSYYDTANGRLYYITKNGFQYSYNPSKYTIAVYDLVDGIKSGNCLNATYGTTQSNGISTVLVTTNSPTATYNDSFAMEIRDFNDSTNLVKTIYFTLYNELPQSNETTANNTAGQFKILDANGNNITKNIIENLASDETGYFSEIRILYSNKETFIPIKYSISRDKRNWEELTSGTRLRCQSNEMEKYYLKIWYSETYIRNEMGTPEYIFGYVPNSGMNSQIFEFNLSSLTSTFWVEKTVNGVTSIVNKNDTVYKTSSGTQYSNHYLVNLNYSDKDSVQIKTNKEQEIKATWIETFSDSGSVMSEHYVISNSSNPNLGNIPAFNTHIVITYIPNSDNFVSELYTYNTSGIVDTTENLINLTSKSLVISENYASINRIELQWSKFYGIVQNEIKLKLVKDGIELSPVIYTRKTGTKEYNYVYLTHSGKYSISLYDNAGNVQKFNRGNAGQTESFTFVFIKDVPFTIVYTNPTTGLQETSLPIKQAVYNGSITVKIDKNSRSEYYSLGGYPVISVKKNGVDYTGTFQDDTTYIFTEPGYYEIFFTATSSLKDVGRIRQEIYQFTILNPSEHRYSYVYNRYSNYYVEKVVKNDVDITESLLRTLDVATISVDQKTYMTELPLSYLDEKTGAGTYLITINSNDKLFKNSSAIASWTYKVIIQVGAAPLKISLGEGNNTTKKISVTFNKANIYNEMGECTIKVVRQVEETITTYYKLEINQLSSGEESTAITDVGTYYIQIISPSGNLLYSYKVIKKDPLNAAAIIIIVVASLVVIAVIFIIVKLRKRISVK